jgi:Holliday junction resolvase RusA-like endonuclease
MPLIEVPGVPRGKQRPRFYIRKKKDGSNFFGSYTPKDTILYENAVKMAYQQQWNRPPITGAVRMIISAYFPPPSSISNTKRKKLLLGWYDKKPDIDNIAKAVIDGLNGVAFLDDRQIVNLEVRKFYGERPVLQVLIEEMDIYMEPDNEESKKEKA